MRHAINTARVAAYLWIIFNIPQDCSVAATPTPAYFAAMGCGASKSEVLEGSAVTGIWNSKVVMPEGVAGEQIAGGWKPGAKFQKVRSFCRQFSSLLMSASSGLAFWVTAEHPCCTRLSSSRPRGWLRSWTKKARGSCMQSLRQRSRLIAAEATWADGTPKRSMQRYRSTRGSGRRRASL